MDLGESKTYTEILGPKWRCWEVTEPCVREFVICGEEKPEPSGSVRPAQSIAIRSKAVIFGEVFQQCSRVQSRMAPE